MQAITTWLQYFGNQTQLQEALRKWEFCFIHMIASSSVSPRFVLPGSSVNPNFFKGLMYGTRACSEPLRMTRVFENVNRGFFHCPHRRKVVDISVSKKFGFTRGLCLLLQTIGLIDSVLALNGYISTSLSGYMPDEFFRRSGRSRNLTA